MVVNDRLTALILLTDVRFLKHTPKNNKTKVLSQDQKGKNGQKLFKIILCQSFCNVF